MNLKKALFVMAMSLFLSASHKIYAEDPVEQCHDKAAEEHAKCDEGNDVSNQQCDEQEDKAFEICDRDENKRVVQEKREALKKAKADYRAAIAAARQAYWSTSTTIGDYKKVKRIAKRTLRGAKHEARKNYRAKVREILGKKSW
ncbi:MAG: hypothetical protein ACKOA8_06470 [Deltaproteobacteria bacterium]